MTAWLQAHLNCAHRQQQRCGVAPVPYTSRSTLPLSPNTPTQHLYWLYRNAGVSGASSHSGCKKFLTSLASQGVSVFVLASLVGHKSIATTQCYITVNDELESVTHLSAPILPPDSPK